MASLEWFKNVDLDLQIRILIQGYVDVTYDRFGKTYMSQLTCENSKLNFKFWSNKKNKKELESLREKIKSDAIIKRLPGSLSSLTDFGYGNMCYPSFYLEIRLNELNKQEKEQLFGYFALKGYDKYIE